MGTPLAAAADAAGLDVGIFAQYGVLGIMLLVFVLFAKGAYQRECDRSAAERERADRMELENKRLNELILDRVVPVLTSAAAAAQESTELLNAMQREREMDRIARRVSLSREGDQ